MELKATNFSKERFSEENITALEKRDIKSFFQRVFD